MREIVHIQAGQCGNQIGAKVGSNFMERDAESDARGAILSLYKAESRDP